MSAPAAFDIFLSHNSSDKPTVKRLAEALASRGIRVWLDEEQLVPGRPWQESLEAIIQSTKTVAVLIGNDGLGPWEDPEVRACLSEFARRKLPVIPVLLPSAGSQPELPLFLRAFTWVDLRSGIDDEGLGRLVWGIKGSRGSANPNVETGTEIAVILSIDGKLCTHELVNEEVLHRISDSIGISSPVGFRTLAIDIQLLLPEREAVNLLVQTQEGHLAGTGIRRAELSKERLDVPDGSGSVQLDSRFRVSLMYVTGSDASRTMRITKQLTIIGRHPYCDVVLDEPSVSRFHCAILCHDGEFYISDLRSRAGTHYNGHPVTWQKLAHKAEIKIAGTGLQFLDEREVGQDLWSNQNPEDTLMGDILAMSHSSTSDLNVDPKIALPLIEGLCEKLQAIGTGSYPIQHEELSQTLLNEVCSAFPFVKISRAFVAGRAKNRDVPEVVAWKGPDKGRISEAVFKHVMLTGQGIHVLDSTNPAVRPSDSLDNLGVGSSICAPLLNQDSATVGIIQLDSPRPHDFSTADLELLVAICTNASRELHAPQEDVTLGAPVVFVELELDRELTLSGAVAFRLHWAELARKNYVRGVSFRFHKVRRGLSKLCFSAGRLNEFFLSSAEILAPFTVSYPIDWLAVADALLNGTKYEQYVGALLADQAARKPTELRWANVIPACIPAYREATIVAIDIQDFTRAQSDSFEELRVQPTERSGSGEGERDEANDPANAKSSAAADPELIESAKSLPGSDTSSTIQCVPHAQEFAARVYENISIPIEYKSKLIKLRQAIIDEVIQSDDRARALSILDEMTACFGQLTPDAGRTARLLSEFNVCCSARVGLLRYIVQAIVNDGD